MKRLLSMGKLYGSLLQGTSKIAALDQITIIALQAPCRLFPALFLGQRFLGERQGIPQDPDAFGFFLTDHLSVQEPRAGTPEVSPDGLWCKVPDLVILAACMAAHRLRKGDSKIGFGLQILLPSSWGQSGHGTQALC